MREHNTIGNCYSIIDFGAVSGTGNVNTVAIQSAVDKCSERGGGTVVIPCGTFYTGSIQLYSNITLYLENGAVLKSTAKKEDFPYIGFWHNEMHETTSLIWARNRENIRICGDGIIDISSEITYESVTRMAYFTDKPDQLCDERKAEPVIICAAAEDSEISRITVNNLSGVCENGIIIYGKKHNIRNIRLDNIDIKVKETDYFNDFCDGLDMRPYAYEKNDGGPYLLYTYGTGQISLSNVNIDLVRT